MAQKDKIEEGFVLAAQTIAAIELILSGGSTGQVLTVQTDGSLAWETPPSGGGTQSGYIINITS